MDGDGATMMTATTTAKREKKIAEDKSQVKDKTITPNA